MSTKSYLGSEVKFLIEITAQGFSMQENDWKLVLKQNKTTVELNKSDCHMDTDGNWYFPVNTELFSKGKLYVVTYAYVPDRMFEDGFRTEIDKQLLLEIEKV